MDDPLLQDPARQAVLEELRQSARALFGEERASEAALRSALEAAATAAWRVGAERLEPLDPEPDDGHG